MPCKLETLFERLFSKVQLDWDTGCWNWTGAINKDGYGQIGLGDEIVGAHRASWRMFVGEVPEGMELDHICRNRVCVNYDHLRVVTHKEQCANRGPKQVCRHGHRYDEVGFHMRVTTDRDGHRYEYRVCDACLEAYKSIANAKRRAGRASNNPTSPEQRT